MRLLITAFLPFIFCPIILANEVTGKVEVVLKGDKKKSDIASTIVYLDQTGSKLEIPASEIKKPYSIITKNKQFTPEAIVIPVGGTVDFPNQDPIFHNIFSVSAPNQFDLGLYKGGASKSKTFDAPGIVKVFCNVHPQMSATILVVQTPYQTITDKDGNFTFPDVVPGVYEIKAFADEGQSSQKIDVRQNSLNVTLTIDGRNYKKVAHKNKFGKDYTTDENEKY
jgi:plastocyanin